jgi:hypothetical protein
MRIATTFSIADTYSEPSRAQRGLMNAPSELMFSNVKSSISRN